MRYVVRVQRLSARVQVTGLAVGDERIRSFDVDAKHYVNNGSLPVRIKTSAAAPGETREGGETTTTTTTTAGESTSAAATEDRSTLANDIRQCFKGGAQIEELAGLMKTNIVQPLMPGLHKEGYEETGPSQEEPPRRTPGAVPRPQEPPPLEPGARPPERPEPYPVYDPLAAGPSRPPLPQGDLVPPGFEDEYEIQGSLRDRRGPPRHPPTGPGTAGIGYDDLYPAGLGPHDPLRPQIGIGGSPLRGGLPFGPFGGGGESRRPPSGMHPTFTDPLFGAGGAGGRGAPGAEGGGAFGPQRPEGSRWDPVMPPAGGPRPGPGPGRRGGGMAGDPSNPFSQFPPDAFM